MLRILLPTDFSANAMHAARYAAQLFGSTDAEYTLIHAHYDVGFVGPEGPAYGPEMVKVSEDGLAHAVEKFKAATGAKAVKQRLLFGPLAMAIKEYAAEAKADVVVMGKRGATGSMLFGSNTTDVIKASKVPVLAVPEQAALLAPRRILLGSDHEDVRMESLAMLRTVAQRNGAEVIVAHLPVGVPEGGDHWSNALYELALKGVPHSFAMAEGDDAVEALERTARKRGADMMAVLHRHLGLLDRGFRASTAKELALQADLPLLVLEQKG